MRELSASTHILAETALGPICLVEVIGDVRSRVGGIAALFGSALSERAPAAIVFDLSKMSYVSWDDIGVHGLVMATRGFKIPACIVCSSKKRKNLDMLMEMTKLDGLLGDRAFESRQAGLAFVEGVIAAKSV